MGFRGEISLNRNFLDTFLYKGAIKDVSTVIQLVNVTFPPYRAYFGHSSL